MIGISSVKIFVKRNLKKKLSAEQYQNASALIDILFMYLDEQAIDKIKAKAYKLLPSDKHPDADRLIEALSSLKEDGSTEELVEFCENCGLASDEIADVLMIIEGIRKDAAPKIRLAMEQENSVTKTNEKGPSKGFFRFT